MSDFELTLKGDGISVERSIDRLTALAVLNTVLSGNTDGQTPTSKPSIPVYPNPNLQDHDTPAQLMPPSDRGDVNRPTSLREFVDSHLPKTNAQIILCIAQYLMTHQQMERLGREAVRHKFAAAGEPMPKNFTRDFQTAIDKGWLGEDPLEKDQFYVTRTGENQLSNGFGSKRN